MLVFRPLLKEMSEIHAGSKYYGSHELLVWEAVEFAKRAKAAGVDVSLRSLSEGQHNFLLGAGRVPEVDQAIKEMAQWLRSKLRLPEARK